MAESPASRSPVGASVLTAADAKPREFLGIPFDLLATGDRLMVTRMRYETGMTVAAHAHEHEQAGYVISGRYRQTAGGAVNDLGPGDSYVISGGVEHAMEVLEAGHVIDVFTSPREDYR